MEVPTYPDDSVQQTPTPSMRGADISSQVQSVGTDQATALAEVSEFLNKNVQQGKERALDDYKRQLDEAHVAISLNAMSMQDQDALQSTQIAMQQWKDAVAKVTSDIGFSDVADKVQSYADQKGAMLEDSVGNHERSEATKFDHKNVEARQRLLQTTAALNAGDPVIVAAQLQQAADARKGWCARNGIPTEGDEKQTALFRELQQGDTSKIYTSSIDALLIAGNIGGARLYFDAAKKEQGMTADDILETEKKFLAAEKAQKESAVTAYLNLAMQPQNKFKPLDELDKKTWVTLTAQERETLYNAIQPHEHDPRVWTSFEDALNKHPQQLISMSTRDFASKYIAHFDKEHQEHAWNLWHDAITSAQRGDTSKLQQAITDQQLMQKKLVAYGQIPAQGALNDFQQQIQSQFVISATRALQDAYIKNGNVPLTFTEKENIIDDLCRKTARVKKDTNYHDWSIWSPIESLHPHADVPSAAISPSLEANPKYTVEGTPPVAPTLVTTSPTPSYNMGDPIPPDALKALQTRMSQSGLDASNRMLTEKLYKAFVEKDYATASALLGGKLQ